MAHSLRSKVRKLVYQGHLTEKEGERIRDALAKQIPKKKILKDYEDFTGSYWACPDCGCEVDEYCPVCGQKIDWSN